MRFRQPAIIYRLTFSSFVFFHIAAVANPFRAHRRQALFDIPMKIWVAPQAACIVNAHRLVHFNFTVHRFCWREGDLAEGHTDFAIQLYLYVNLLRIWKLTVTIAHKKIELGEQEKGISFPGFLIVFLTTKSRARKFALLRSPVRHRTLAPFGGITRIRFKGSAPKSSKHSQPCGSPALSSRSE